MATKEKRSRPKPAAADAVVDVETGGDVGLNTLLAKARVAAGIEIDETTAIQAIKNEKQKWEEAQAEVPPYDPASLNAYVEVSPDLAANIAGYVQNIEGNGHQIKPIIDLNREGIDEELEELIRMDRMIKAVDEAMEADPEADLSELDYDDNVSQSDVKEIKEQLDTQIRREMFLVKAWFRNCGLNQKSSFHDLRERKRRDEEGIGHAAWECIRDEYGKLRRLGYIAGHTIFPVQDDGTRVEVEQVERMSPITTRTFRALAEMPLYIQIVGEAKLYYKTLGDPRIVSRTTGKVYETTAKMQEEEQHDEQAREVIWFEVFSPRTPCGIPRWIGALLKVLANRSVDKINYNYVKNNTIPAGLLLCDGQIKPEVRKKLVHAFRSLIRGEDSFAKLMIIDDFARKRHPGDTDNKPTLEFKSLLDFQRGDAMFREYAKDNSDAIGETFRQPPALRGRTPADLNRATYIGSLHYGEQQVYSQLREKFDWVVNQTIMPAIGATLVQFVSNSPTTADPEAMAKQVDIYAKHGGLMPKEVRDIAGAQFNQDLEPIDAEWMEQPLALTLALGGGAAGAPDGASEEQLRELEDRISLQMSQQLREMGIDADIKAVITTPQD